MLAENTSNKMGIRLNEGLEMDFKDDKTPRKPELKLSADEWAICRDRGLTEKEQQDWEELSNHDPDLKRRVLESEMALSFIKKHAAQLPADLLADTPIQQKWYYSSWSKWGAAAAIFIGMTLVFWSLKSPTNKGEFDQRVAVTKNSPRTERLSDGSVVRINEGSKITYEYSDTLRRIHLIKGEAHFTVIKDATRPFSVSMGNIEVKAVGTAFNIKLDPERIDVFVTDGTVEILAQETKPSTGVETPAKASADQLTIQSMGLVSFGQRAEIGLSSTENKFVVQVNQTNETELKEALIWRESLLTFTGSTLEEIALEFNQKTGLSIHISDPELNQTRIGGNFPSDDPFGFLNILKNNYGVSWDQSDEGTIFLSKEYQ